MKNIRLLLILFFLVHSGLAQETPSTILFIYDASGSMWGQLEGSTKQAIASSVLATTVGNLPDNQHIGLIAYGHRKKGDCDDIETMVALSNTSKAAVTDALKSLNPTGKTPLAKSATMAINSLQGANTKATLILITDGIESCDGDLCQVVSDAKLKGIDFKLHIVGFGLKEGEKEQLKCAATAGNGNYYDATDASGLGTVLTEATTETVDAPEGNFSIYAIKNGEPVDAWVRAKSAGTNKDVDGARTYRDTAFVSLPTGNYNITIQPLENTDLAATSISVTLAEGETQHRDISFDSGKINVTALNNNEAWDATVRVVPTGGTQQVAQSRTYGKAIDLEVNPGVYDVHLKLLQVKGITIEKTLTEVMVTPNATAAISHNFESGTVIIGVQTTGGELIDATVNFIEQTTGINVDRGRTYTSANSNPKTFVLNPGTYDVKIKTLGAHKGHSETVSVTVTAGETVQKKMTY